MFETKLNIDISELAGFADTTDLHENRSRWGALRMIHVKGVDLEVYGATQSRIDTIIDTLNFIPVLHIRQIPRIVAGDRVGPIGTGRITRGGNSSRRGSPANWRLEITNFALDRKIRNVNGRPACFTLLHEVGHWVDWQLGMYPRNIAHQEALERWFLQLNYGGVTLGRGERVAEAYWRYFLGGLPGPVIRILEATPAFTMLHQHQDGFEYTQDAGELVDRTIAVRIFSSSKRREIKTPVLDATQNAEAITWNAAKHPTVSGVDGTLLRNELTRYIDFSAVSTAIVNHNSANPDQPIAMGSEPMDAVFVEAVHQFQLKCFLDTKQHDGKAGPVSLDSLGIIDRTGMNPYNKINNTSKGRLRRLGTSITVSGINVNHTNWFDFITNPTFFGWQSNTGIHYALAVKLRQAENHLIDQTTYQDITPAELGHALGLPEKHKGYRANKTNGSMHNYGLAIDIDYTGNPWVKGNSFWTILKRAVHFVSGRQFWQIGTTTITSAAAYYHHLARHEGSTAAIYDNLKQLHDEFRSYLALRNDLTAITSRLNGPSLPTGLIRSGETVTQAARRWKNTIRGDFNRLNRKGNFVNRNPAKGFLNLHRDLVIALRDHSCLAWGGVDFGNSASGDMMHFDVRSMSPYDAISRLGGGFVPGTYHPCRS